MALHLVDKLSNTEDADDLYQEALTILTTVKVRLKLREKLYFLGKHLPLPATFIQVLFDVSSLCIHYRTAFTCYKKKSIIDMAKFDFSPTSNLQMLDIRLGNLKGNVNNVFYPYSYEKNIELQSQKKKSESLLPVLIIVLIIPNLILMVLANNRFLGYDYALLLAVCFPASYTLIRFFRYKRIPVLAVLALLMTILTGVLGLLRVSPLIFALKEAMFPAAFTFFVYFSIYTEKPLIVSLVVNERTFDIDLIEKARLDAEKNNEFLHILYNTNLTSTAAFAANAMAMFFISLIVLKSQAGSSQFAQEMAKLDLFQIPLTVIIMIIFIPFAFRY